MRKRKYHGTRKLLNKPGQESTAAIVAEIEDTSTWKKGFNGEGYKIDGKFNACPYANLVFSDCTRSISYSMGMLEPYDYENSLYKVDTMIGALLSLRDGMTTERERYLERIKDLPDETS